MALEPLSRTLLPVDLSPASDALVDYIKSWKRFNAEIMLVHVIEESIVVHAGGGYDVTGLISWLTKRAQAKLKEYREALEAAEIKVDVYHDIPVADPGSMIPEIAKRVGASEIAIASKGWGLSRVIPLGSTVNIVIKLSSVPVIRFKVVKDGDKARVLARDNPFSRILVGVDVNASKEMIEYSVRLAAKADGKLIYAHVVEHGETPPPQVKNAFRFAEKMSSALGVESDFVVVSGGPAKVLLQLASHLDASSILLGRTVNRSLEELILGSTLDKLLKVAPQPVIVYPL